MVGAVTKELVFSYRTKWQTRGVVNVELDSLPSTDRITPLLSRHRLLEKSQKVTFAEFRQIRPPHTFVIASAQFRRELEKLDKLSTPPSQYRNSMLIRVTIYHANSASWNEENLHKRVRGIASWKQWTE